MTKLTIGLILITAIVFMSTSQDDAHTEAKQVNVPEGYRVTEPMLADVRPETSAIEGTPLAINTLCLGRSIVGFKEALAFKESQGKYQTVNVYGYMGKYQFGKGTLEIIGIHDINSFLRSPALQERAFMANTARNKWILRRDIKRFSGEVINGVEVTESGILAAAHLAGPGAVKKYLRSGGKLGFKDAFGTSILYYMKKFGGYDTSSIEPIRLPRAL